MKLIIMSGAPGCGKSTWARGYRMQYHEDTVIVSRDAIRFSLLKDGEHYFSKENEVLRLFYNNIVAYMRQGYNVIADASHLTKKARLTLINEISRYIPSFDVWVIYIHPALEVCYKQNDQRTGRANVPHHAIANMYYSMTDPKDDGYFYEKIVYVGDEK